MGCFPLDATERKMVYPKRWLLRSSCAAHRRQRR